MLKYFQDTEKTAYTQERTTNNFFSRIQVNRHKKSPSSSTQHSQHNFSENDKEKKRRFWVTEEMAERKRINNTKTRIISIEFTNNALSVEKR